MVGRGGSNVPDSRICILVSVELVYGVGQRPRTLPDVRDAAPGVCGTARVRLRPDRSSGGSDIVIATKSGMRTRGGEVEGSVSREVASDTRARCDWSPRVTALRVALR